MTFKTVAQCIYTTQNERERESRKRKKKKQKKNLLPNVTTWIFVVQFTSQQNTIIILILFTVSLRDVNRFNALFIMLENYIETFGLNVNGLIFERM